MQGENAGLTCSLGYLPRLAGVSAYCRPEQLAHRLAPTKHNVVCGGRSVHEVVHASPDYQLVQPRDSNNSNNGENNIDSYGSSNSTDSSSSGEEEVMEMMPKIEVIY